MRNGYPASAGKPKGREHVREPSANGSITKTDLKETECEELEWIKLGLNRSQ
jgi:hypothetical protein